MASGYPDFEGDKQKVYLAPEWAAKETKDKNIDKWGTLAVDGFTYATYAVPTGKTVFITGMAFSAYGTDIIDRDLPQIAVVSLWISSGTHPDAEIGGNGGGSIVFAKPMVATAGQIIWLYIYNRAGHGLTINGQWWGYEV